MTSLSFGEAAATIRRRIDLRRLVLGDLGLKGTALVVATVLFVWASAVYSAPPREITVPFEGRVPIARPDVPPGFVLRAALGDVAVKLRGPEDVLRRIGAQQLSATIDLAALAPSASEQEAPVRVSVDDPRVRVVEVSPATAPVRLERLAERVLPVQPRLANAPPAGFTALPATFRPQQVTIRGPESAVGAVAAIMADVRFGDTAVDLAQDVRPLPVDAAGAAVKDVEVDPVAVHVSIPVVSSATTRTVPILYHLSGEVAQGYWISRVTTDPVAVTVSGGRDAVSAIDHIQTAIVDVTGLSAGRTFTVGLAVPAGVRVVGPDTVKVGVTVVALTGSRPFPLVAVRVEGLGPGLVASVDPAAVDVVVTGVLPSISAIDASAVVAAVNVAGRGPGTYSLEVSIRTPAGIAEVRPARATVTISSTSTPTPAATPTPAPTPTPTVSPP